MTGYYTLDVSELVSKRNIGDRQPFPHQMEAFAALSKTLPMPIKGYRGTLLVLPTGAGKTYTSINWICRNILSQGVKVLWLAQSSFLIDQAAVSFQEEMYHALGRDKINLRIVSSSTEHANAGSIILTDDVLICTTQTAIGAYASVQLDGRGNVVKTPFRKFVDNCSQSSLFVVIDEAHHTPAYGCRTLLLTMRQEIPNLYILGLTATPMHMDKRISGWLKNIYDKWICYEADKSILQANKILSVPKYIQMSTGMEFEVDDGLYDRLVNKHKDLPDYIIENLAQSQSRNNLIVSDYVSNQAEYGKTIIFADRWFQCQYLVEKLKQQGVQAAAIYSVVAGQHEANQDGSGRRNDEYNRQIMKDFKAGSYDVVVNVRMFAEGVDVPDVKTVVVTRQTTSNILLTQMIGRALRGEKTGGGPNKDYANIVFFHDSWKRLLPWANVAEGLELAQPDTRGSYPMSLISIQLIKLATADIEYKGFENVPYLIFIPVGFWGCEYTVAIQDGGAEELISFAENVIVYEFNKDKYTTLIDHLLKQDLSPYADESLSDNQMEEKVLAWVEQFFDMEKDGFDGMLVGNVGKIVRHIAQNGIAPTFIDFHERDLYDMDKLAEQFLTVSPLDADVFLTNIFNDMGLLWNFLYKRFDCFMDAYYKAQKRVIAKLRGQTGDGPIETPSSVDNSLAPDIRHEVLRRDNYACVCCGKTQRKGVTLQVDHILPVAMGGRTTLSNLQTLCNHCNKEKGVNEVDYRTNVTPLRQPKTELKLYDPAGSDDIENTIARTVNSFYHCKALCQLNYHERRNGQYYSTWEIVLYSGNGPKWLSAHSVQLLGYINHKLGMEHVKQVIVRN